MFTLSLEWTSQNTVHASPVQRKGGAFQSRENWHDACKMSYTHGLRTWKYRLQILYLPGAFLLPPNHLFVIRLSGHIATIYSKGWQTMDVAHKSGEPKLARHRFLRFIVHQILEQPRTLYLILSERKRAAHMRHMFNTFMAFHVPADFARCKRSSKNQGTLHEGLWLDAKFSALSNGLILQQQQMLISDRFQHVFFFSVDSSYQVFLLNAHW